MSTRKRAARVMTTAIAVGIVLGAAASPASAWPLPLTSEDNSFLNSVRGTFPGDDDQLLLAGRQACRQLYTGQGTPTVISQTAAQYGASPDQAAALVSAARGTYCTQAPG